MKELLALLPILLLLGCVQNADTTQAPTTPEQTGSNIVKTITQPSNANVFDVVKQMEELGLQVQDAKSKSATIKVHYSKLSVDGEECDAELLMKSGDCSGEPSTTGSKTTFCAGPFKCTLTSDCDVSSLVDELSSNPNTGKRITSDIWIPWPESADELMLSLSAEKGGSTISYTRASAKYNSVYPKTYSVIELSGRRAFKSGGKVFFFIKDPTQMLSVSGSDSESIASNLIKTQYYYDGSSTDYLGYLPKDWYGTSAVPLICYHPFGIVKVDEGIFKWKDKQLYANFNPTMRLLYPSNFAFMDVNPLIGGKQLEAIQEPYNSIEEYGSHYKACMGLNCMEACSKPENVLVFSKSDCSGLTTQSQPPSITEHFDKVLDWISRVNKITSFDKQTCFGLLDQTAESIVLGSELRTRDGLIYARPVIVDRAVEVLISTSTTDPQKLLKYLIKDRTGLKVEVALNPEKDEGSCHLFSFSKDLWTGFAGYCEGNPELLFFNTCSEGENCEPSATQLFNNLTE